MYEFIRKRLSTLFLLFLSALGFSLALLIARVYGHEGILYHTLNFQSTITLIGFILQMGFRASLRMHIHKNRVRIVVILESMLILSLLLFSFVGLFFEIIISKYYFISASSALAVLTLKLTLSVAREDKRKQLYYTVGNFFLCLNGVFIYILFEPDILMSNFILELVSLIILLLVYIFDSKKIIIDKSNIKLFTTVLANSQSFQLGSGFIFFAIYILTQVVLFSYAGKEELLVFADMQILSGGLVLLIGQILLIVESKIYKNIAIRLKLLLFIISIQALFVIFVGAIFYYIYNVSLGFILTILFVLTSRVSVGYIVQYINEYRYVLVRILFALMTFLGFIYYHKESLLLEVQLIPCITFLTLGTYLIYKESEHAKK